MDPQKTAFILGKHKYIVLGSMKEDYLRDELKSMVIKCVYTFEHIEQHIESLGV